MANCAIDSTGSVALIEGLRTNKTLTSFNIESNMSATPFPLLKNLPSLTLSLFFFSWYFFFHSIGGPGFEALAQVLLENNTIKELRVANQRQTVAGKPERVFVQALEKNTSVQKLGFSPKDQTTRNLVDKYIFRNRDLGLHLSFFFFSFFFF